MDEEGEKTKSVTEPCSFILIIKSFVYRSPVYTFRFIDITNRL